MTPAPSATTVSGDRHGATCSWPSSSLVKVIRRGQKSVERAGRPGRLTGIAAGGSVARLVTVSVSGQPRSLAAAAFEERGVEHSTITDLPPFGIAVLPFKDPDGVALELTAPL